MKRLILCLTLLLSISSAASAAAPATEKVIFGPTKYDVKARYGTENVYKQTFTAIEGQYLVKLQNGAVNNLPSRSDFIEFTLNGEKLLKDDNYNTSYIDCVVTLQKENSFALVLKDFKPSSLKRPQLPPRFVTVSVVPLPVKIAPGVYGFDSLDGLNVLAGLIQKIKVPESASFAVAAVNLKNDAPARTEAARNLADRKDASALEFLTDLYKNETVRANIRGEAALGLGLLGEKSSIPLLIDGVLDPEDLVRLGSTRALSFYKEDDTREPLSKILERLDAFRREEVIRAIMDSGLKPVGALITLGTSSDPYVASTAIRMLGNMGDPKAVDLLLRLLEQPGKNDARIIITALGETKDSRAIEALRGIAQDPAKRAGKEAELGEALSNLRDQKAADVIAEMIKKTQAWSTRSRLMQAYKKLTGKEFK